MKLKLGQRPTLSTTDLETVPPNDAGPGDYVDLPGLGTWRVLSLSRDRLTLFLAPSWIPRPTYQQHASLSLKTGNIRTHHHNKKRLHR